MITIHPHAYNVRTIEPWEEPDRSAETGFSTEVFEPDLLRHHDRQPQGGQRVQQTGNRGNYRPQSGGYQKSGNNALASAAGAVGANLGGLGMSFHLLSNPHHGDAKDLVRMSDYLLTTNKLETDFTPAEMNQVAAARKFDPVAAAKADPKIRDMRDKPWSSIDNDTSRDLDQIEYSERLPDGSIKVYVAIADVDALVPKGSEIDKRASNNTTSIYVTGKMYPMLPEEFSTDLTSLNPNVDRLSMVTEMTIAPNGTITQSQPYRALVNNHCQLAYNSVAKWLDSGNDQDMPAAMKAVPGIDDQVKMQNEAATRLRKVRQEHGALQFASQETHATVENGKVLSIDPDDQNTAQKLIEDLMVATNGVNAKFLADKGYSSIRRVVVEPQHWDKIVRLAGEKGFKLPDQPDSVALEAFLEQQKAKDPDHFKDLSLDVVKLIGRGQYILEKPGAPSAGHFALAVDVYSHTTAPNRLDGDLKIQRILKAALEGQASPYSDGELTATAVDATAKEKVTKDIERYIENATAAMYMQNKVGQQFNGWVNYVGQQGSWVRLQNPHASVFVPSHNFNKGDRITVQVKDVNIELGKITANASH